MILPTLEGNKLVRIRAKSLFKTKTFQGAFLGLLGGLAPLIIPCFYQRRLPNEIEAIALAGLLTTFGWALIGRVQTSAVYTPEGIPGPNKSDF